MWMTVPRRHDDSAQFEVVDLLHLQSCAANLLERGSQLRVALLVLRGVLAFLCCVTQLTNYAAFLSGTAAFVIFRCLFVFKIILLCCLLSVPFFMLFMSSSSWFRAASVLFLLSCAHYLFLVRRSNFC